MNGAMSIKRLSKSIQVETRQPIVLHIHLAHLQQEDARCLRVEASLA